MLNCRNKGKKKEKKEFALAAPIAPAHHQLIFDLVDWLVEGAKMEKQSLYEVGFCCIKSKWLGLPLEFQGKDSDRDMRLNDISLYVRGSVQIRKQKWISLILNLDNKNLNWISDLSKTRLSNHYIIIIIFFFRKI